ncbi:MAG TPA: hypothetical protein VFS52_22640 [Steroidobacteraceae bacterium]|nr:hypothetical protein [Steroidobacteraceae bacterium]
MRVPKVSHLRLMQESEARIAEVARDGTSALSGVAQRILDDTRLYQRWEAEHDRLMRTVAGEPRGHPQAVALRRASFGFVHRKAMFEYLRLEQVTGRDRHAVFALVFGDQHDYAAAVIQEHSNYVRSATSHLCVVHLGLALLQDKAFAEPFWRYEQLYADYFRAFCGTALGAGEYKSGDTLRTLLPYLKRQLSTLRRAILVMPTEPSDADFRNLDFQAAAANTQRIHPPIRAAS